MLRRLTHRALLFRRDRHRRRVGPGGIFVEGPLERRTEMPDQALDRPRGSVAERANRVTLDLGGDFEQQPDLALGGAPFGHAGEHAPHPAGALAAGRALAAALVL